MGLLLQILGDKTSLQPVFSWLFMLIALYFNCNSSLVLGGAECQFHLFHSHLGSPPPFLKFLFKDFIYWSEEKGRETWVACLSHGPTWAPGPQPRHVPSLGIKPATFWFAGQHPTHWATTVRAVCFFLNNDLCFSTTVVVIRKFNSSLALKVTYRNPIISSDNCLSGMAFAKEIN